MAVENKIFLIMVKFHRDYLRRTNGIAASMCYSGAILPVRRLVLMQYNGLYMKRSHVRTLQLSSKLSGYVLYTVL